MLRVGIFVEGTFIPSYEGATRRFQALASHLTSEGVDVTVFHCYRGWSDIEAISDQPYRTYFIPPERYYEDIELLCQIIKLHNINVLIMSEFLPIIKFGWLLKEKLPWIKIFFEIHDIHSDINLTLGRTHNLDQIRYWEQLAFLVADLCVCFTKYDYDSTISILDTLEDQSTDCKERFTINSKLKSDYIIQLPFGVDNPLAENSGPDIGNNALLFLGNLFHAPNRLAVECLATIIAPQVFALNQNLYFLIVGDTPDNLFKSFSKPNFKFIGKVANLQAILSQTTIALAPVFHGSGIKVKMLDYCSAGLPIICSSVAARGILDKSKENWFIEDDPNFYVHHIKHLLDKPEEMLKIGQKNFQLFESFEWTTIVKETKSVYDYHSKLPSKKLSVNLKNTLNNLQIGSYFLSSYLNPGRFSSDNPPDSTGIFISDSGKKNFEKYR